MKATRLILAILGAGLLFLAAWQIRTAEDGLTLQRLAGSNPPVTLIYPASGEAGSRPLVLIAHGYAASQEVMRGFAIALAQAGYATASWDFKGHAANPNRLVSGMRSGVLVEDAENALQAALEAGVGDPQRVAILGHSMGSGVALFYGQAYPETSATIAVSPVGEGVTPQLPRNLLLLAGSREPMFVLNAQELLRQAGGTPDQMTGDPAAGTARQFSQIPNVEHVSILFAPAAHAAAREWLNDTFGVQADARPYTDMRIAWYGLGLLGTAMLGAGLAGWSASPVVVERYRMQTVLARLGSLIAAAVIASGILWAAGQIGIGVRELFGLQVGGYVLAWFGLAGLAALVLLRPSLPVISARAVVAGLLAFALLWLGMGWLGQQTWLHWVLIPPRWILWGVGAALAFPWFLAVGSASQPAGWLAQLGWWLAHSALLAGGMYLSLRLMPDLGFILLLLPLFPLVLGMHALVAGPQRSPWAYALSGALFLGWTIAAVFPLG